MPHVPAYVRAIRRGNRDHEGCLLSALPEKLWMSEINSIKLQSNLLLPTYLKNLSNIQIKLVWQNAAIELSEATRIVFIGYSLPAADFEIRQLLARMIRPDAEIQVVLYPNTPNVEAEAERYRNFFGSRISEPDIMRLTVPEYVKKLKTKS